MGQPLLPPHLLLIGAGSHLVADALGSHGILPFRLPLPLMLVQGHMPTLAVVLMAGWLNGREGIRAVFRKLLIVRVGFRWYAFAIFSFFVICIAAVLLANRFGPLPALPILSNSSVGPVELVLNAVLLIIVSGVISGEEFAWRGFALPRLQAKYSALTSSLILAVPWVVF